MAYSKNLFRYIFLTCLVFIQFAAQATDGDPNHAVTLSVTIDGPSMPICYNIATQFTATPHGATTDAISYTWYKNGSPVQDNNPNVPVYVYNPQNPLHTNDVIKCVIIQNSVTAFAEVSVTVADKITPTASVTVPTISPCTGDQLSFGSSSPYTLSNFQWKFNNTNVGTAASYSTTQFTNNDVVSFTANVSGGCFTTNTVTATSEDIPIDVKPIVTPSVSITVSPSSSVCSMGTATFTASPVNGGSPSYQWKVNGVVQPGSGATFTKTGFSLHDSVKVVMTSSAQCRSANQATSNSVAMSVTTSKTQSVSISDPGPLCNGYGSFTATPTNAGSPVTYTWYKNGVQVTDNNPNVPAYVYNPLNPLSAGTKITCVLTSTGGTTCLLNNPATSNEVQVSIINPTVSISASRTSICQGDSIKFTANSAYTLGNYQWKLGNTNVGTNSATFYSTAIANSSVVTVTANVTGNCSTGGGSVTASTAGTTFNVTANVTPDVSVTFSPSTVCSNSAVTFTAHPQNGGTASYRWQVNGVNKQTGSSATFVRSGLVNNDQVKVVMTSGLSCVTTPADSSTVNMSVTTARTQSVSISNPGVLCSGKGSFTATPANSGTAVTYNWYKNGIAVSDNTSSLAYVYVPSNPLHSGDSVSVRLTSTAGTTCLSNNPSVAYRIVSTVTPTVTVTPSMASICPGDALTFTASSGYTLANYQWKVNGVVVGGNSPTFTTSSYTTGNLVTLNAVVSGACPLGGGSVADTASAVTVKPAVVASIDQLTDKKICATCTQSITAAPTGAGYSYEWQKNSIAISGATSASYAASMVGAYRVKVSLNGCSGTSSVFNLSKNVAPVVNAGPDRDVYIENGSVQLTASGTDSDGTIVSFLWSKVSGPSVTMTGTATPVLTLTNLQEGTYTFRATTTDDFNDASSDDVALVVENLPNNYNSIRETTVVIKNVLNETSIAALNVHEKQEKITYFDGLGRSMQQIGIQASPDSTDLVQPVVYDQFGREAMKYLPYAASERNGYFKINAIDPMAYAGSDQYAFYHGNSGTIPVDDRPFTETIFESSPANRPLKNYGPGDVWHSSDKFNAVDYTFNVYNTADPKHERVIAWKIDATTGRPVRESAVTGVIITGGYYASMQLQCSSTRDEQGHEVREFRNNEGQVVLKKVQAVASPALDNKDHWAQTYYIYDDLGLLRFVLQPELTRTILQNDTYNPTSTDINNFAFSYSYDAKKRMIQKQVPGAQPVYMVYDKRDRLILSQDGNQRTGVKYTGNSTTYYPWVFTKYDALNRPVLTGIKDTTVQLTQAAMQTVVDTFYCKKGRILYEVYTGGGSIHGYTNNTYPKVTRGTTANADHYLTVAYYDNYDFKSGWASQFAYTNSSLSAELHGVSYSQPATANDAVIGAATGGKVKVLDDAATATWLKSVSYYDDRMRPIQVTSDNYKTGYDRITTVFDFASQPLKVQGLHNATALGSSTTRTVTRRFNYDHAGRVTEIWHQIAGQPEVLLAANRYNALGHLIDKDLHSGFQSVDYRYNIRGWLTSINNADLSSDTRNNDINDFFGMELLYTEPAAIELGVGQSSLKTTARSNYDFNGNANDSGLDAKNGSASATLTSDRFGIVNKAYAFNGNGTSSYIDLPGTTTTTNYIQNTGVFTISAFIKLNDLEGRNVIISSSNTSTAKGFVFMYENYDATFGIHQLRFSAINGISSFTVKGAPYTINDYNWHHVAVVGDGTNIRFYVDGQPDGPVSPIAFKSTGNSAYTTKIGRPGNTSTPAFVGCIDEVLMFNTALTDAQIKMLTGNVEGGGQYNGNIAAMKWSNNLGMDDVKQKQYNFSYDAMNRLTNAIYTEGSSTQTPSVLSWNDPLNGRFNEGGLKYDLNGNIRRLIRTDASGKNMDVLSYDYGTGTTQSNQLLTVADDGNLANGFREEGNPTGANDYTYDANGNMVFDRNKGGKDVVINGNFEMGATNWTTTGLTSRVTFDSVANITTGSALVSVKQTGIIAPLKKYIVVLDLLRTSGSGGVSISLGGASNMSIAVTGRVVVQLTAGSGNDITINFATTYAGKLKIVEVKALMSVAYNHLNLPNTVTMGDDMITYIYDATGRKLSQIVTKAGVTKKKTDYAGEYFYENDTLKFINHEEGRVVVKNGYEYQYQLKDHLGNVRMTFTTKLETESVTATLENANTSTEQTQFLRYQNARRVYSDIFNHTSASAGYSERLNGSANEKFGLAKSVSVMPGDTIKVEVYAKYVDSNSANWTSAFSSFLSSVANGTAPSGTVVDGGGYASSTSSFAFGGLLSTGSSGGAGPKAFLNWIVFDRNYVMITGGYQRMSDIAKESGQDVAHEKLSAAIPITQAGYVYIYLSNEETSPVEVYFDDFKVTQVKSPVVQMDDYYPFGLVSESYQREGSVANNYLFNGKELQDELKVNWMDYGARMYMQDIGRWGVIDPHVDKYAPATGYNYTFNNPINLIDPTGMDTAHPSLENDIHWGSAEVFGLTDQKFTNKRAEARAAAAATSAATSAFVKKAESWLADFNNKNKEIFGSSRDSENKQENGTPDPQTIVIGGADLKFEGLSETTKTIASSVGGVPYNVTLANAALLSSRIVATISANYEPGQRINIYGYSLGGKIAMDVARGLEQANIPVSLLFTVDAAESVFSPLMNRTIPSNVAININFYQLTPSPIGSRGDANKGTGLIFNYNLTSSNITHGNVDEAVMTTAIYFLNH